MIRACIFNGVWHAYQWTCKTLRAPRIYYNQAFYGNGLQMDADQNNCWRSSWWWAIWLFMRVHCSHFLIIKWTINFNHRFCNPIAVCINAPRKCSIKFDESYKLPNSWTESVAMKIPSVFKTPALDDLWHFTHSKCAALNYDESFSLVIGLSLLK